MRILSTSKPSSIDGINRIHFFESFRSWLYQNLIRPFVTRGPSAQSWSEYSAPQLHYIIYPTMTSERNDRWSFFDQHYGYSIISSSHVFLFLRLICSEETKLYIHFCYLITLLSKTVNHPRAISLKNNFQSQYNMLYCNTSILRYTVRIAIIDKITYLNDKYK